MKRTAILLLVICFCGLVGCGTKFSSEVKIDYGNSTTYSEEDMDDAIKVIKKSLTNGTVVNSILFLIHPMTNAIMKKI